jgi:hypothetical protein
MPYETFSRRRRRERGQSVDVFQYDEIPPKLRVQILHIFGEFFGLGASGEPYWKTIRDFIRIEVGVFELTRGGNRRQSREEVSEWLLDCEDTDHIIDFIEFSMRSIRTIGLASPSHKRASISAIEHCNFRIQEAGVGYEFIDGTLVEMNSKFIHSEIIIPALRLLHERAYNAADAEFRSAHEALRAKDYEGCIVKCSNAFESVLKVICTKRGWIENQNMNSKNLLDIVFSNGLVPDYMSSSFKSLRGLLESSVPVIRNKSGGHGAGSEVRKVSRHLAEFQIHQTASVLLFLVRSESEN